MVDMSEVERLVEGFRPERYNLALNIHKGDRKVIGRVEIIGRAEMPDISLHAKGLKITRARIGKRDVKYEISGDKITLFGKKAGKKKVFIDYEFDLTEQMHGAYLSHYECEGNTEWIVATQFESHYAREVFPCVDEPEAKAEFALALITDNDETVLGNMPIKAVDEVDGRTMSVFEITPKMSTYLLAFVVGKFNKVTAKSRRGVGISTYASLAQPVENLEFASSIATRVLDFYEGYFGVPYPLPKLDQVALPDFEAGAMENWGLMTFRESCLLVDQGMTAIADKQHIATVIAHEISHQWFGNLVTMKWWDDLWLNESFASMMEYVAVDRVEPEFNIWESYFTGDVAVAMRRDALSGVQSVKQSVSHPDEIQTLFDGAIVYAKGARLMYMLMNYMGESNFRKGLRDYFTKYAYGNTVGEDLWESMNMYAIFDIKELMEGWVSKPGYPVVSIKVGGSSINLQQGRFAIDRDDVDDTWSVPLFSSNEDVLPAVLDSKVKMLKLPGGGLPEETLELNVGMKAHFLSNYEPEVFKELSARADSMTKFKMLMDQELLAKTKMVESASLFGILRQMENEESEAVWSAASLAILDLRTFIDRGTDEEKAMRRFVRGIAWKQYGRLGWERREGEKYSDTKLRGLIMSLMIYSGDEAMVKEAMRRYDMAVGNLKEMDKELRESLLIAKVKYGSTSELVERLLSIYKGTQSVELRSDIMSALTATVDSATIERLIGLIKDREMIRLQDVAGWFVNLIRNRCGQDIAWKYLRDNWEWFKEIFGDGKGLDDYPRYVAGVLRTDMQLSEYKEFFEPMLEVPALKRSIEMGMGEIEARIRLIESDGGEVRRFLHEYKSDSNG